MKMTKKITIGGINNVRGGFKEGVHFKADDSHIRIATIFGSAHAATAKNSETMGTSFAFTGEFKGINKEGEEFFAPVCYLPEPAQGMLAAALQSGAGNVEFAFDVILHPDATALLKYSLGVESLLEVKQSSALEKLSGLVAQRALPSPEPAPEKPSKK